MTGAARLAAFAVFQTLALLGVLLWLRPVGAVNRAIDWLAGLSPEAAMTIPVRRQPDLHETSLGDAPKASFERLAARWHDVAPRRRVLFTGNSQMQMAVLAPNERLRPEPERTYFDWVAEGLAGRGVSCYRLSAGALSYSEALWYLTYLTGRPETTPGIVILQTNYAGFANGGVREGIAALLDDEAFAARIEKLAADPAWALSEPAREALARHRRQREASGPATGASPAGETAAAGHRLETATRAWLDRAVPGLAIRDLHKVDVYSLLFRARVHVARIRSGGARSIAPARLAASRAALEAIAALCRERGIRLIIFRAPVNPSVTLFKTESDRTGYEEFLAGLCKRYGGTLLDFEASVPAAEWGNGVDGPDPLHLGRAGHKRLAELLIERIAPQLGL